MEGVLPKMAPCSKEDLSEPGCYFWLSINWCYRPSLQSHVIIHLSKQTPVLTVISPASV